MSDARRQAAVLSYAAPFVTERLVANKSVRSSSQAEQLFEELLRYLWLIEVDRARAWPLCSSLIAETWQQFLLFSFEYERFCRVHFQGFVHPRPVSRAKALQRAFARRYQQLYGRALPEVWCDGQFVDDERRMIRDRAAELRAAGDAVELVLGARRSLRQPRAAENALRFVCEHGIFYVRELPLADADQRSALCRALLQAGLLRLAR